MSREQLLEEIKETLRSVRLALPNYRAIQETKRYNMGLSDIEDVEQMYGQYIRDTNGIFELEDFVDTLTLIRGKSFNITWIMDKYIRGEWQKPTD